MKIRFIFMLFACTLLANHVAGQSVQPFVKGGLTISFFDSNNTDNGYVGVNIGAGIQMPVNKSHSTNSSFCRLKPLSKYDKYWCFKNSSYLQT